MGNSPLPPEIMYPGDINRYLYGLTVVMVFSGSLRVHFLARSVLLIFGKDGIYWVVSVEGLRIEC